METKREYIIVGLKRLSWVLGGFFTVLTALLYGMIAYELAEGIFIGFISGIVGFFLVRGIAWVIKGFYFGKQGPPA